MKLMISKNDKGYYTKITNEYNNEKTELYLTIQLSKSLGELEYGLYEVDGFMSCFNSKDGVKPKLILTSARKIEKKSNEITHNDLQDDDPFTQYAEQVEINDDMLD